MMRGARLFLVVGFVVALATPVGASVSEPPSTNPTGHLRSHFALTLGLCHPGLADQLSRAAMARSRPSNPEHFTFPARMTSTRVARIRALARDICGLPLAPTGVEYCARDYGVNYTLYFVVPGVPAGVLVKSIHYESSGCLRITGAGATRLVTSAFIAALGSAFSLNHATTRTFVGSLIHP